VVRKEANGVRLKMHCSLAQKPLGALPSIN